jgi:hypothetical protein
MQFTRCVQISALAYFATVVNYARKMLKTLSPALNFPCFCETFVDEMFLTHPYLFFSSNTTTILFWSAMGNVWVCHILSYFLPLSFFSLSLSLPLSLSLSIYLSVYISIFFAFPLSRSSSVSVYLSVTFIFLLLTLLSRSFFYPFLYSLFVSLSIYLSLVLPLSLSIFPSLSFSCS